MMMKKTWISNTMLPFLGCWGLYDSSRNLDAVKSSKFEESPVANPVLLCAHRRRVMTFNCGTLSFHSDCRHINTAFTWLMNEIWKYVIMPSMDWFILKHTNKVDESYMNDDIKLILLCFRLYQGLEWVASQINSRWWSHVRRGGE